MAEWESGLKARLSLAPFLVGVLRNKDLTAVDFVTSLLCFFFSSKRENPCDLGSVDAAASALLEKKVLASLRDRPILKNIHFYNF